MLTSRGCSATQRVSTAHRIAVLNAVLNPEIDLGARELLENHLAGHVSPDPPLLSRDEMAALDDTLHRELIAEIEATLEDARAWLATRNARSVDPDALDRIGFGHDGEDVGSSR